MDQQQAQQLEQMRLSQQEAEEAIRIAEALKRLESHSDFQQIILNGYLTNHAVQLVRLLARPDFQTPEKQDIVQKEMTGISALNEYFRCIVANARQSQQALFDAQEEQQRLYDEEQEDGEEEEPDPNEVAPFHTSETEH